MKDWSFRSWFHIKSQYKSCAVLVSRYFVFLFEIRQLNRSMKIWCAVVDSRNFFVSDISWRVSHTNIFPVSYLSNLQAVLAFTIEVAFESLNLSKLFEWTPGTCRLIALWLEQSIWLESVLLIFWKLLKAWLF